MLDTPTIRPIFLNCRKNWVRGDIRSRLVHLDVEDCSKELLRQQSYAIKNHLVTSEKQAR